MTLSLGCNSRNSLTRAHIVSVMLAISLGTLPTTTIDPTARRADCEAIGVAGEPAGDGEPPHAATIAPMVIAMAATPVEPSRDNPESVVGARSNLRNCICVGVGATPKNSVARDEHLRAVGSYDGRCFAGDPTIDFEQRTWRRMREQLRDRSNFGTTSDRNDCPPKPGFTLITSTKSQIGRTYSIAFSWVAGFNETPAKQPRARIACSVR